MLKIFLFLLAANVCWTAVPERTQYVRPCSFKDYACIRDNLAANSNCRPFVKGSIPSKYMVTDVRFEAPGFNASYIDNNLIIRNHDKCFVSDFVINTNTSTARLVVDCPLLEFESDRTMIQHASFSDDAYYYYHIHSTYPLIRLNVNLPSRTHMNLCTARVFTDVTALPKFHIDPRDKPTRNYLSQDLTLLNMFERETFFFRGYPLTMKFVDTVLYKPTAKFLSRDLSLLNFYQRESFYYKGYLLLRVFVNSLLCDYGCRLSVLGDAQICEAYRYVY